MTIKSKNIIILLLAISTVISAKNYKEIPWLKTAIDRSQEQLLAASEKFRAGKLNPRSFENGKVNFANYKDWTCGFFPGSLWYMYEITNNEQFKKEAEFYTELLSGKDKAASLRLAKLRLIKSEAFSHPYYWAPFIQVGTN